MEKSKTQNTSENKNKFFAQYYGQNVLKHKDWVNCVENNPTIEDWNHSGMLLQLKPINNISDESLNSLFKTEYHQPIDNLTNILMGDLEYYNTSYISEIIDKIRLNGFAWPWLDLDVQDLMDYGWIKLTEN